MIIQCLGCGKAISSHSGKCPYCISEINHITLELNGIAEKPRFGEKVRALMLGLVHK